jgi:hypothetical protein
MKVDTEGAGLDEARLERIGDHLRTRYLDPGKIAGAQVATQSGMVAHSNWRESPLSRCGAALW